jgi:hypothetical protein
VIVNFEPWFFLRPAIESAKISQEVKLEAGRSLQETAGGGDMLARHDNGGLAESLHYLDDPLLMLTL